MSVRDLLRVLREQWWIPALAVVVSVAAAAGAWLVLPTQYTSSVTLYFSAQADSGVDNGYNLELMAQQRVASYVDLASSDRVAREVVDRLALDETPGVLRQQISVSSEPQTTVMDVTVTGASPEQVAAVANTVGDVVSDLVGEFEPTTDAGTATVSVRALEPAAVPTEPSSIKLLTALVLGVLGGLVVGVAAALVRDALDRSLRSTQQLRAASGVGNLAVIPLDPHGTARPLIVGEGNWQSARAEAFRRLRTNLRVTDLPADHSVIVVTSASPGEGRTTTVCNLAIAIASTGRRVAVVDADLRRPGVSDLLGLTSGVGLTDVLADGRVLPQEAVQTWAPGPFDVLTSGPQVSNPGELLTSVRMKEALLDLRERYDVVLVDAAPLLPYADAAVLAPWTDGVVLVCRYGRTSAADVAEAAQAVDAVSAYLIGTVFTMVPRRAPASFPQQPVPDQVADGAAVRPERASPSLARHRWVTARAGETRPARPPVAQGGPRS